jgi:threonine dehydrogenase-like Zn-dependent dehydrogenase
LARTHRDIIYGAASPDLEKALHLISEEKVDVSSLITHCLLLAVIQKGFDIVTSAGESLKVVLNP